MIKRKLKTDRLEAYLKRAKWEHTDLTIAANISPLSLSNWLSRSHGPTPRMMDKITVAINDRYIQLGLCVTIAREDILDEVFPEIKHKIRAPVVRKTKVLDFLTLFWGKVDQRGIDECWFWTGRKGCGGYGSFWTGKSNAPAHRIAWELTQGPIPDGLLCLHKCDRPPCVNPSHLYIGTHSDNLRDRMERFRRTDPNEYPLLPNRLPS